MKYLLALTLCIANLFAADGLRVKCERVEDGATITCWGSGCFVAKNRILTSAHVVEEGVPYAEVDGKWVQCKFVRVNAKDGLALLECPVKGRPVEVLHLPEANISGSIESAEVTDRPLKVQALMLTGKVGNGDSGAPILIQGRLVGMLVKMVFYNQGVEGETQNESVAVSADRIEAFLEEEKKSE